MSETYVAFSNITVNDVIAYIRLDEADIDEAERNLLSTILAAARSFVLTYTGKVPLQADTYPEFTIAVYAICEEMHDKRTYTLDKNTLSPIIDSILGSRSVNLL